MEVGTCFSVNKTMFLSNPMTQKSSYVPNSWLNPLNLSFPAIKICTCRAVVKGSVSSLNTQEKVTEVTGMSSDHSQDLELSSLSALYPLDGCYWGKVKELAPFMSEYGLIRFRILVEIKWLVKLSQIPQVIEVPSFSERAQAFLQDLIDEFSMNDALEVKKIERVTNHDVNAVEYFLKQRCQSHPEIVKDINNLAHALMFKGALDTVILPVMDELIRAMCDMDTTHSSVPMLSRTHGQPASPTTLGKEMAIFAFRLSRARREISQIEMLGKFAGAVGNYNAHIAAYPEISWPEIAEEFVVSLGLKFNPYVPQHNSFRSGDSCISLR
ncbi:Adenylosuccinate lyase [Capsicum annuum]|nr:Adenylosuccinate lyase [Capsicum annuum]